MQQQQDEEAAATRGSLKDAGVLDSGHVSTWQQWAVSVAMQSVLSAHRILHPSSRMLSELISFRKVEAFLHPLTTPHFQTPHLQSLGIKREESGAWFGARSASPSPPARRVTKHEIFMPENLRAALSVQGVGSPAAAAVLSPAGKRGAATATWGVAWAGAGGRDGPDPRTDGPPVGRDLKAAPPPNRLPLSRT